MTTRAAAAALRGHTVAQGADTGGLALTAPELLAAAARARPASAKRGSHDPSEQMRDMEKGKGTAGAGKKRAALGDISNISNASGSRSQCSTQPMLGTRELDALMSRPLSNTEARLQLEQRRLSHSSGPRAAAPLRLLDDAALRPAEVHSPPAYKDIDAGHKNDPLMCTQYIDDIYSYLRVLEASNRPHTSYMEQLQRDINHTMRGILVDWLVEVAEEYKLVADTLFLAVNFIDRCLSKYSCVRSMLQLVGVTCMLVAAKFEEIYAPQVDDFCYITDNTYQHIQVLEMERKVLDTLGFNLATPTAKTFIRRYLRAAECAPNDSVDCLASFLAELTLLEYGFLRFKPSMVAACTVLLALHTLEKTPWSMTLEHYTGYMASDLKECAYALHAVYVSCQSSNLPAIREKYMQPRFNSVAALVPPSVLPDWIFGNEIPSLPDRLF